MSGLALALCVGGLGLASCDGSSSGKTPGSGGGGDTRLSRIEYGRLVDIYAYRRVDPQRADRRDLRNRVPVLIERDVVISPNIEGESLFDAVGEERPEASYRFLPFNVDVGHEELLVMWDDRQPGENERYQAAVSFAKAGLVEVPASFRDQNSKTRPIPVVPRNAALKLTFTRSLSVATPFFSTNPSALQLLEFKADPKTTPAPEAFRPLNYRVLSRGNELIVDTTLIGRETGNGNTSAGLPSSTDNVTANIRLAIPVGGVVSRDLNIDEDPVTQLNGSDSRGDRAVIRDFRSGNENDGPVGSLTDVELPMVVAHVNTGITRIDRGERIIELNKRYSQVAIRGRVPFVDGGLVPSTGLPGGPPSLPTEEPLRTGDILMQEVLNSRGDPVVVRAEILEVLDVGTVIGDKAFKALGLTEAGTDGGELASIRVRVASLDFDDGAGGVVSFQANDFPLGEDATVRVHYYHHVAYSSNSRDPNAVVSDERRARSFLSFDPAPPLLDRNRNPIPRGTLIVPDSAVALRFSEPMDLERIEWANNFVLANATFEANSQTSVAELLREAKPSALSILATRLIDQERNGTLLRLQPPMGHYHEVGETETYWFHMMLGQGGAVDLAGNPIDLYDRRLARVTTFSASYTLDPDARTNAIASRLMRFDSPDEDGTPPGSVDYFGQFQIRNGRLYAAETVRFGRIADAQTLAGILRYDKGECYHPDSKATQVPGGLQPPGALYWTPDMTVQLPNSSPPIPQVFFNAGQTVFGGVVEPHNPRGSRLQMRYIEDDFQLGYTDPSTYLLDVEQMHWSPWLNDPAAVHSIQFDTFDRVTIAAAHSSKRPDLLFGLGALPPMGPPPCEFDCASLFSGLLPTFAENPLQGTQLVDLAADKTYSINPNDAFRAETGTIFVPWVKFDRSYTWRDMRLVSWNTETNEAIGLGGARLPNGVFPNLDRTAHVDSPWIPSEPSDGFIGPIWVFDSADFRGDAKQDHPPVALPLMLDFKVFPDDPTNGVASGVNLFHIAMVGPIWTPAHPGGYYNSAGAVGQARNTICGGVEWPLLRVHTSGGIDGLGQEYSIDPANTFTARGGWIKDGLLGDPINGRYHQNEPGDDHLHWAQADFVRKVSMVTFGFFDTQLPNQHDLPPDLKTAWSGLANKRGIPDFPALGGSQNASYSVGDLIVIMDPPPSEQPPGTKVTIEFRGADTFLRSNGNDPSVYIYDRAANDKFDERGNLLNPSYACEAYRYAMPNAGQNASSPRVEAKGLTPYVELDNIDDIRDPVRGNLPRFLNFRVVFENNTQVTPAVSPSLRSLAIVYRMNESK